MRLRRKTKTRRQPSPVDPVSLWPAEDRWVKDATTWREDDGGAYIGGRPEFGSLNWDPFPPEIEHVDGVPWYEAPIPAEDHVCVPQTKGWVGLSQWWRCACGAIAHTDDLRGPLQYRSMRHRYSRAWMERNSRIALRASRGA